MGTFFAPLGRHLLKLALCFLGGSNCDASIRCSWFHSETSAAKRYVLSTIYNFLVSKIILLASEFQSILINAGFGPAESKEPLPDIETASLHAKGAEISVISANSLRITSMGLYCFLRLCFEKNLTSPSTLKLCSFSIVLTWI